MIAEVQYRRRVLDDVISGRSRSLPWSGNKVQSSDIVLHRPLIVLDIFYNTVRLALEYRYHSRNCMVNRQMHSARGSIYGNGKKLGVLYFFRGDPLTRFGSKSYCSLVLSQGSSTKNFVTLGVGVFEKIQ